MIHKKQFVLYILIGLLIMACKDDKNGDANSSTDQMKAVLAIHDEIMKKTEKFGSLVGQLSSLEDSTEMGIKYKHAREDLQADHQSMMKWMQDFGNKFEFDEISNGKALSEQKLKWLNEAEKEIKALEVEVNRSLSSAESLLDKKE